MRIFLVIFFLASLLLGAERPPCSLDLTALGEAVAVPAPVDRAGNLWVRRGDLFLPFGGVINGDKLRQTLALLLTDRQTILSDCNNKVMFTCRVDSNHSFMKGIVARKLGHEVVIGVAGKDEATTLAAHPLLRLCEEFGCSVRVISRRGYETVLNDRIRDEARREKAYVLDFKEQVAYRREALIGTIADQVRALPEGMENLVIPTGTGMTAAGVITGLLKYNHHPRRVVLLQNGQVDRREAIDRYLGVSYPYDYQYSAEPKYAKWVAAAIPRKKDPAIALDGLFESKAYLWLTQHLDPKREKTVLWVTANSGPVRASANPK